MVNAARDNKRIVQTGSQQRSAKEFRHACELVRNGALGKLSGVKVGLPGPNWSGPPVPDTDPPAALDYDRWLGPAPQRPFNAKRVHYLFRFFWDYSGGQQTNFGAHDLDITQWALGMDDSGPTTIEGTATFNKDRWFETPETANQTFTYANGVKVHCTLGKGGNPGGVTFEGEKGTIYVKRGALTVTLNGEKVPTPTSSPPGRRSCTCRRGTTRTGWSASRRGSCRCATSRSATARRRSATWEHRDPHRAENHLGPESRNHRRR
jgi:predicted dehydrogenase